MNTRFLCCARARARACSLFRSRESALVLVYSRSYFATLMQDKQISARPLQWFDFHFTHFILLPRAVMSPIFITNTTTQTVGVTLQRHAEGFFT
jgi:hypothetical protein